MCVEKSISVTQHTLCIRESLNASPLSKLVVNFNKVCMLNYVTLVFSHIWKNALY